MPNHNPPLPNRLPNVLPNFASSLGNLFGPAFHFSFHTQWFCPFGSRRCPRVPYPIAQRSAPIGQSIAQSIAQSSSRIVQLIAQSGWAICAFDCPIHWPIHYVIRSPDCLIDCLTHWAILPSHCPIRLPSPNAQSALRIAQWRLGNPIAQSSSLIA